MQAAAPPRRFDSRLSILEWAFRTAYLNHERKTAAARALEESSQARARLRLEARKARAAFSLVELLLVIAIIAIMASIVIAAFSNASQDSREVLVRQQQAVVQEAVNSWIAHNSSGYDSATPPQPRSLTTARSDYNAATTGLARLALLQPYLDDTTYSGLAANTTNSNQVRSDAMVKTSQYLNITDWPSGSYPKVILTTLTP